MLLPEATAAFLAESPKKWQLEINQLVRGVSAEVE
jgi:hypothetical protein